MIGIETIWKSREYKIPTTMLLSLNQETLILQSEYLSVFKIAEIGTEFTFSISDFDMPIDNIIKNPNFSDLEYQKLIQNEEWQMQKRLEEFRRLEAILKEEGII